MIKKIITLSLTFTVLLSSIGFRAISYTNHVMAATAITSKRISGNDRYETTLQIVRSGWTSTSDYAIVVTGENFPDALCAAPLAKKYNAPIILTNSDGLNLNAKVELQRLKVKNVIIVGGIGVVSLSTQKQIESLGIYTQRIFGSNRYETSEKVAERIGSSNQVVIATGEDFPDALSIASIAASKGIPILLTDKNGISNEIKPYLTSNTIVKSYVIGGIGVLSYDVFSSLKNPIRLSGNNRYDTNIAVLNEFRNDLNSSNIIISTGSNFPDALACSALSALTSSPMILIDNSTADSTQTYIHNNFNLINNVTAVGGTGVISDVMLQNVMKDFGKEHNNTLNSKQGNTVGNLNNQGMFVNDENNIYTTTLDANYILKTKLDGSQKQWLNWQRSSCINLNDDYIFYINIQDGNKIYRMNTNGTNLFCLNNVDFATSLVYYNKYLYYVNGSDNSKIYRMNINGTERIKVSDDIQCQYLNVTDKYIYYSTSLSDSAICSLYRIDLEGSNRTLINGNSCNFQIVDNNYIYFINQSDKNALYSMKNDGTEIKKLNDDDCSFLNLSNDVLYYANYNDESKIYAIKTDGSNRTVVNKEKSYNLNIINDTIHYMTELDSGYAHSIKTVNLDTSPTVIDKYSLGNLPGNINNEAFVTYDGKYIYSLAPGIHRYNSDNTNEQLINKGTFSMTDINVVGDWVYYSAMSPNFFMENERIYKVRADGTGDLIELSNNRACNMTVVGDFIYYTTNQYDTIYTGSGPIHKLKTDGTGETYLDLKNFDYALSLNFIGDYIYYINTKDNMKIYKIKNDGTGREKVSDDAAYQLNISKGYLYYLSQTGSSLKKAPINGGASVTIQSSGVFNPIVTNNKIFYVRLEKVYSCNLDGSEETYITDCTILSKLNIAGDYLYYTEKTSNQRLRSIKIN